MSPTIVLPEMNKLERRTTTIGFWFTGLVIAVVAVSYVLYSEFSIKILVWIIGLAFLGVAILAFEWSRAFRGHSSEEQTGGLRIFLAVSIPLAFILDSQICGLGLAGCSTLCNAISFTMIGLGTITAVRLYQRKSIGTLLVSMVVIGLIPHCTCHAPINTLWHGILGGYAHTCQVIPLVTTLFAVSAFKGVRNRLSSALVGMLLAVTLFIVVGNPLWSFPWADAFKRLLEFRQNINETPIYSP